MERTKIKTKNQVTIPKGIVTRLGLKENELFEIDIEKTYIKLIPVQLIPKYTEEELKKIDRIVVRGKKKAKSIKAGKGFSSYIKNL